MTAGWAIDKTMQRVLITGISGFVGSSLQSSLDPLQYEVYGFDLRFESHNDRTFAGEITDRAALVKAIRKSRPDIVFHLAGVLKAELFETFYNVHVLGTSVLFEAIMETGQRPRVVLAGSSAVYGSGSGKRPISESFKPRPATHYAVSKLTQELVAFRYHTSFDLPVMCVRTFNLLGPGLSPDLAPAAFARQIVQAEKEGLPAKIFTGDLSARRDYVDVRDAVRAYALVAERGSAGQIYNVCSGRAIAIRECLRILSEQARVPIETILDPARVQNNDIPIQVGSADKIRKSTGWKPKISTRQSLLDLLNNCREKVK
jgi:GDP-4-dehydro-6-deoxy-D-mannose reductase